MIDKIAFNLLFNSTLSFAAGMLLVSLSIYIFKVGPTRWKLALLTLPFVKIVVDLSRGIPASSYLFAGFDPWFSPPKHNTLAFGGGLSFFGPVFNLELMVRDPQGADHAISLADFFQNWLGHSLFREFPTILLAGVLLVSLVLVMRRLTALFIFEKQRRIDFERGSVPLTVVGTGLKRKVCAYIATGKEGSPFTGGIVAPYICFPEQAHHLLDEKEREAVLLHEMAHIRSWDSLTNFLVKLLGDLFWFVPGYRFLSRRMDRIREIVADRQAVKEGASGEALASALVRMKTALVDGPGPVLYSALVRSRPLVAERVEYLLFPERVTTAERFGWQSKWIRPVIAFWILGGVIGATLAGNI